MKVSDLIRQLQQMPQNLPIYVCDSSGSWMPAVEACTTIVPSEDGMGTPLDINAVIVTAGEME